MKNLIPISQYPELIDIIEDTYTDGIDRILSGEIRDDGSISIIALDGVKKLDIEINDTTIQIKLLNPDSFDETNNVNPQQKGGWQPDGSYLLIDYFDTYHVALPDERSD